MRLTRPSRSLRDHHGEWCAYCFRYFAPPDSHPHKLPRGYGPADRDEHHVLPRTRLRHGLFRGLGLDFAWTVPVHRQCHNMLGGIQIHADAAFSFFTEVLAGAPTLGQRAEVSAWLHNRGYYWLAVLANVHTLRDRAIPLEPEERQTRLRHAYSSAAGIRGGNNILRVVLPPDEAHASTELLLQMANYSATRGHSRKAKDAFESAERIISTLPIAARNDLEPQRLLRTAQVDGNLAAAQSAEASSDRLTHGRFTAWTLQQLLALRDGIIDPAERAIEAIGRHWDDVSWLYRLQAWFMRAALLIEQESTKEVQIYRLLTKAQFVYVFLCLQLSVEMRFELGRQPQWALARGGWTPADLIGAYFRDPHSDLRHPEYCFDVRQAVLSKLYDDIQWPMQGQGADVLPRGRGYRERMPAIVSGDAISPEDRAACHT